MSVEVVQRGQRTAVTAGALAAMIVGGSVPVVGMLDAYPMVTGQAIRYALGGVILLGWARAREWRIARPRLTDLWSLVGLAAIGMLGFNAAIIVAQRYGEPGFVAAVLGGTPLVLAIVGPVVAGRRPSTVTVAGAGVVVVGIAVLSGGGSWHGPGLALALLTMACEASFTLLAVGVVRRLGAVSTATWCCLVAAVGGALSATVVDGTKAWPMPSGRELTAIVILAVGATAIGFCCWYKAVNELGSDRAGVLIGLMPIAGFVVSVALGAQPLTLTGCIGAGLVTAGCIVGLRR